MRFLLRILFAVVLVVGGLSTSEPVSARSTPAPCHETSTHHHAAASTACAPQADHAGQCPSALGVCCPAMVMPGTCDAGLSRRITVVVWATAPAYDLSDRPTEPATPPPRV